MSDEKVKPWRREVNWQYCGCGGPLINDTVYLVENPEMPFIPIAEATFCGKCRRVTHIKMTNRKAGVSLVQVERTFRGGYNAYTRAEFEKGAEEIERETLRTIPDLAYNPDAHIEPAGGLCL
jgi:hypothetical protein